MDPKYGDRKVPSVPFPRATLLGLDEIFPPHDPADINLDTLRDHLQAEGKVQLDAAFALVEKANSLFLKEKNVLRLRAPVTMFGDIHGQFYDLLNTIKPLPVPTPTDSWLFLGDYVDRGSFGVEVVLFLFALKIKFPSAVFMIRGNHECRHLTNAYNFKKECMAKYKSKEFYASIMLAFDALPLAVLVDGGNDHRFLCVHGGLSPSISTIQDIEALDRFKEPPKKGPMCDILWSDPLEDDISRDLKPEEMAQWYAVEFEENDNRGAGYVFGYSATVNFLNRNNLTSIIRAHDVQREGFYEHHMRSPDNRKFPLVVTVFSAPNYCGYYENQAAFLRLEPARKQRAPGATVTSPPVPPTSHGRSRSEIQRPPATRPTTTPAPARDKKLKNSQTLKEHLSPQSKRRGQYIPPRLLAQPPQVSPLGSPRGEHGRTSQAESRVKQKLDQMGGIRGGGRSLVNSAGPDSSEGLTHLELRTSNMSSFSSPSLLAPQGRSALSVSSPTQMGSETSPSESPAPSDLLERSRSMLSQIAKKANTLNTILSVVTSSSPVDRESYSSDDGGDVTWWGSSPGSLRASREDVLSDGETGGVISNSDDAGATPFKLDFFSGDGDLNLEYLLQTFASAATEASVDPMDDQSLIVSVPATLKASSNEAHHQDDTSVSTLEDTASLSNEHSDEEDSNDTSRSYYRSRGSSVGDGDHSRMPSDDENEEPFELDVLPLEVLPDQGTATQQVEPTAPVRTTVGPAISRRNQLRAEDGDKDEKRNQYTTYTVEVVFSNEVKVVMLTACGADEEEGQTENKSIRRTDGGRAQTPYSGFRGLGKSKVRVVIQDATPVTPTPAPLPGSTPSSTPTQDSAPPDETVKGPWITPPANDPDADYLPRFLFTRYGWTTSPFWLPTFENAIQYSMKYLIGQVCGIVNTIVNVELGKNSPDDDRLYTELEAQLRGREKERGNAELSASGPTSPSTLATPAPTSHRLSAPPAVRSQQSELTDSISDQLLQRIELTDWDKTATPPSSVEEPRKSTSKQRRSRRSSKERLAKAREALLLSPQVGINEIGSAKEINVVNRIKEFEGKRALPSGKNYPAIKRRKSLEMLAGTFKQRLKNYVSKLDPTKFDQIKQLDRENELRPAYPEEEN